MIRRERRDGGEGEERIEKGSRERIEIERKGVNNLKRRIRNIDTCLCLFPQCVSSEFPTRFCSKVLQH